MLCLPHLGTRRGLLQGSEVVECGSSWQSAQYPANPSVVTCEGLGWVSAAFSLLREQSTQ